MDDDFIDAVYAGSDGQRYYFPELETKFYLKMDYKEGYKFFSALPEDVKKKYLDYLFYVKGEEEIHFSNN